MLPCFPENDSRISLAFRLRAKAELSSLTHWKCSLYPAFIAFVFQIFQPLWERAQDLIKHLLLILDMPLTVSTSMIPSFTHRFLMFPKEDSMPQESSALPLACSCRGGPWRPSDLPWCLLSTQDVKGCVGRSATIYDHLCIFVFKSGCSQPETLNPRHESATARRSTEDRYSNEIIECELRRFCCMTQKYTINNASFVAVNLWRRILGKPDHRRFTSFYSTKWPRRHERWGVESSCNSRSFRLSAWVPCPSHDMFASTDLSILWVTFSPGDFDKSLINFFFSCRW